MDTFAGSRNLSPNPYYIGYWPCFQRNTDADAGSVVDRSGKGNNLTLGTLTAAEAWSTTANRLSSLASGNKHAYLPKATLLANWRWDDSPQVGRRDSLIISFKALLTLIAGTQQFVGNCNSTTDGGGFKMSVDAAGLLSFALYDRINGITLGGTTSFSDAGWSAATHTITVFYDGVQNTVSLYVDGAISPNFSNLSLATGKIFEPSSISYDLSFGSNQQGAAGTACNFYDIHMLAWQQSAGRLLHMDNLARRLHKGLGILGRFALVDPTL